MWLQSTIWEAETESETDEQSVGRIRQVHTLATIEKHRAVREAANEHYFKNAEKMILKYSGRKGRRAATFTVGQNVSVRVPSVDRSGTKALRVPSVIAEVRGRKDFNLRLRGEFGVLLFIPVTRQTN